jgi:hypothetical protein
MFKHQVVTVLDGSFCFGEKKDPIIQRGAGRNNDPFRQPCTGQKSGQHDNGPGLFPATQFPEQLFLSTP